ncbi:DUF3865 domain-containing protein [Marinobacter adhaerens]|jgi:hypothetical protein|uniref:DUF3865 domain-containing protein n=1 Tax=Marinobacter adhaerens TaxID=1033846 RepID=UPI003BAA31B0
MKDNCNLVDVFLRENKELDLTIKMILSRRKSISGQSLVDDVMNPMIAAIYKKIDALVNAPALSISEAKLFIGELSVFARYNSTFLLRASETVRPFCPEFSHELFRNFLEEGGDREKLPAHYVLFTGALIDDLDFRVNGWVPKARATLILTSLIDVLSWSHCPSTILGMYYATEAVATPETFQLKAITNRLGELLNKGKNENLLSLDYYYKLHLDCNDQAATSGTAVEQGHQDGIARFIKDADKFGFLQPQVMDGFLQMLIPFVEQWDELVRMVNASRRSSHQLLQ